MRDEWIPAAAGNRRLIVTADDFGNTLAVNEAVERAHRDGILTCASLMVAAPFSADAVERAKRTPSLKVGLHLVLRDGVPALPPAEIPDLVDDEGRFRDGEFSTGLAWFLLPRVRRQLAAEIEAQFRAFAATGLALDHVNAHKHAHVHPTAASLILSIGKRYGMRALRVPDEPADFVASLEHKRAPLVARLLAPWMKLLRRKVQRAGIVTADRVVGLAWTGYVTEERVCRLLAALPPGTTELYAHPGADYHGRGDLEFAALISPSVIEAARGIERIGFSDLR
ncbi:MAG: cellobiose transporter [Rhodospirillales bacterium]|jgi:hopanoid biosynthesis associated protein HpnK|nr:cellobiose transporter [Rhodospirillales bacterium]